MKLFSRKNGRGSVLLICGLLIGSAAIRVGTEAGQAFATESPFLATKEQPTKTQSGAPSETEQENLSAMIAAFQRREARIAKTEEKIEIRQQALRVADAEIERRLTALQEAEESLRNLLSIASTAAEDDLARLTSVYENMKPKDAAPLFEEMEPKFAAGFLGRMRPDAAAGIMSSLSPQQAYSISVILAGRNAEAPKG